jgi:putative DNA primase/helicase
MSAREMTADDVAMDAIVERIKSRRERGLDPFANEAAELERGEPGPDLEPEPEPKAVEAEVVEPPGERPKRLNGGEPAPDETDGEKEAELQARGAHPPNGLDPERDETNATPRDEPAGNSPRPNGSKPPIEEPEPSIENQEKPSKKRIKIAMGSTIRPRPIAWLWPNWLAHGKLHIFAGRPGSLKTTTAIGLAAAVTVGGHWPDGSRATPGRVVIWSGEDAIEDTLVPRLIAAGGDLAQVAFISGVEEDGKTRSFDPAGDMDAVVTVCADLGGVNLVVIDPVVAVAKGDSHKNAETRRDLQPLVDLAERTQAAVLGIHHLTKRSEDADPLDRVSGSLAFGAGPRVVLLSALDRNAGGEPRGVIMRAKNNLGPAHGGFNFAAETRPLENYPDIAAQRILWGDYVNESSRDILARLEGKTEAALRKTATFLRDALQGGPQMAGEIIAKGEAAGFSKDALRRALKRLGGSTEKLSMGSGWIWNCPSRPREGESAAGRRAKQPRARVRG